MARGSSVLREKAELAILQATALSDEMQHTDLAEEASAAAAAANGVPLDESATASGSTGKGTLNKTAVQQFLSRFDTSRRTNFCFVVCF